MSWLRYCRNTNYSSSDFLLQWRFHKGLSTITVTQSKFHWRKMLPGLKLASFSCLKILLFAEKASIHCTTAVKGSFQLTNSSNLWTLRFHTMTTTKMSLHIIMMQWYTFSITFQHELDPGHLTKYALDRSSSTVCLSICCQCHLAIWNHIVDGAPQHCDYDLLPLILAPKSRPSTTSHLYWGSCGQESLFLAFLSWKVRYQS